MQTVQRLLADAEMVLASPMCEAVPSAPPAPPPEEPSSSQVPAAACGHEEHCSDASAFECNVCLDLAKEPVVTLCGHLYCWTCLYKWTQTQTCLRGPAGVACPVCKAALDIFKVIPIYGRGCDVDPRSNLQHDLSEPVPRRPAGQRPLHSQPHQQSLVALMGLNFGHTSEALTPEQQHQAFLSRLLLMLGSFVIMCLLLF